jgi:CDP-diacylglycerol--glycerol-3-phosphate 3-phosphatidyltransferase
LFSESCLATEAQNGLRFPLHSKPLRTSRMACQTCSVFPAWMVIVIVGREFAVMGLRSIVAASGYTIRASDLGKTKMTAQVAAISLVIAGKRWPELDSWALVAMWAVMLFGVVSAADYFLKFWRKVDDTIKLRRRRELLTLERTEQRMARKKRRARPRGALSEPLE